MAEKFNHDAPNQERDMNNNGILDIHEPSMQPQNDPGYQHQESYEVDRGNTSGAPVARHQREAMAHYAAAHDSSTKEPEDPAVARNVGIQNAAAAALEKKNGSDPNTAVSRPKYEQTLHDIDVMRKRKGAEKKKSSLPAEIASTRPHKEDKAHGAEILTEMFKGLRAGHKHATQALAERQHERNQFEAEAMQLRRANDADLLEHELALETSERKRLELERDAGKPTQGSEGPGKGPGEGGPGNGGDGGPGGSGGPGQDGTKEPENATAANDAGQKPANDVGPEREPGKVAAEAEPTKTPTTKEVAAPTTTQSVPAQGLAKEPAGADATGAAGMGAVLTTVNPALGIAATAIQTQGAQKAAGTDHASEKVTGSKGPQRGAAQPSRQRTAVTFSPGQPTRRLDVPKRAEPGRDAVVRIPIRTPNRVGGLHAQASGLNRPMSPTLSKGTASPGATPRALGVGLGSALMAVMKPVVSQNEGPSIIEQAHHDRRSGAAAGR